MDPVTHVATGLFCSRLIPSPSRLEAAVAGVEKMNLGEGLGTFV